MNKERGWLLMDFTNLGGMFNVQNMNTVFGSMAFFVEVLVLGGAIIGLVLYLLYFFSFNIKVDVYKMVEGTMFKSVDFARMKYDKYSRMTSFKLRNAGVDLSTVINKTTNFIPIKKMFGYGEGIMLILNGNPKEIDSYSVINPKALKQYFDAGFKEEGVENKTSGVSKINWVVHQKRIGELRPQPWYMSPALTLAVQGVGIISIVLVLIFASKAITDILAQASSANVLTQEALRTLVEATNNLRQACVLGGHNVTSSVIPPP